MDIIKKNPLIVVGVLMILFFGFKKGFILMALLFAAYMYMQKNKKDKTD